MSKDSNAITLFSNTNFKKIGKDFQIAKKLYRAEQEKAMKQIEEETKEEKKQLEDAYKRYTDKIDKVLKSKNFKTIENNINKQSNEMMRNLNKAKNEFVKIHKEIMSREDWDIDKKNDKINKVYDYVLSKLYTKEEMDEFKKLFSNIVIITNKRKAIEKS